MLKTPILMAIFFASISAIGNALFAYGQKKSMVSANPYIFLICTLAVCTFLFLITYFFSPQIKLSAFIKHNFIWFTISGIGFFLTFIGFYFLYTRFGTSYYSLYAVLSILTTAIVVGIFIFKESFNFYHGLSLITTFLTILFFYLGSLKVTT
jgi:drug/metabolite transporter (DMT)-like permease